MHSVDDREDPQSRDQLESDLLRPRSIGTRCCDALRACTQATYTAYGALPVGDTSPVPVSGSLVESAATMELFRSQDMKYVSITMTNDSAHATVRELGKVNKMHVIDVSQGHTRMVDSAIACALSGR